MTTRRVKIGIDVGGTFTHAVALDAASLDLIGKTMVPTTHAAAEGVALGVVHALERLLATAGFAPTEVALIAHSTTQATNALLEGDVAPVGILGMGRSWLARRHTRLAPMELAPGRFLHLQHRFLDTRAGVDAARVRALVGEMHAAGARAFVATEAFGVDAPRHETQVAELVRDLGHPVTAACEIAQVYGLAMRTRTAALNAAMLPIMLATADLTERAVRKAGITAPLMIMRSDGGIMDVAAMRKRPILTMLSGPAAGVAAALMHAKISDGVFLEVGGTSTDISILQNGRPKVRTAQVGGHRLALRTLDVRTLGIGGGSLLGAGDGRIAHVGPRSAHIAGLHYAAFADLPAADALSVRRIAPLPGDPATYLALAAAGRPAAEFAITLTEAALARHSATQAPQLPGNRAAAVTAIGLAAAHVGTTPRALLEQTLDQAGARVAACIEELLAEYRMDRSLVTLIGGGGGAAVVVPEAARVAQLPFTLAAHADVISAIGAALGMIRETIERSCLAPGEADVLRIREDAVAAVLRMGAAADSIEVRVEVDSRQKRLIAVAQGTPELRTRELGAVRPSPAAVAAATSGFVLAGATQHLQAFRGTTSQARWLGLGHRVQKPVRVLDAEGIVRLRLADAEVSATSVEKLPEALGHAMAAATDYGDAGALLPQVFVLVGARILDLSGLGAIDQVLGMLRADLEHEPRAAAAVLLVARL